VYAYYAGMLGALDPSGLEIIIDTKDKADREKQEKMLDQLKDMDERLKRMIEELDELEDFTVIIISPCDENDRRPEEEQTDRPRYEPFRDYMPVDGGDVYVDPDKSFELDDGHVLEPIDLMAHELQHAYDDAFDLRPQKKNDDGEMETDYEEVEYRAVRTENIVNHQQGDSQRKTYGNKEVPNYDHSNSPLGSGEAK